MQTRRYPFNASDLHVSYSQVNTYLLCPEQFRQKYLKATPPSFRSPEMVFGSAIHAALAKYHAYLMTEQWKLPLEDLLTEFDDLLHTADNGPVPILWDDGDAPVKAKEQGHALLKESVR